MSLWSRIANSLNPTRLYRDLDEELQSHIEEAVAHGRDPEEARCALGSQLRHREQSRDAKLLSWLDSLRSDATFGLRQLRRNKITSLAAVLSLALAMGACISAFRLIDAVLLRPLPINHPERLYDLSRQGIGPEGKPQTFDGWAYPAFQLMRVAAKDQAELIAVSYAEAVDLTYGSDLEMETARLQYVSGQMFSVFGLQQWCGVVDFDRLCRLANLQLDVQGGCLSQQYIGLVYDPSESGFLDADVVLSGFEQRELVGSGCTAHRGLGFLGRFVYQGDSYVGHYGSRSVQYRSIDHTAISRRLRLLLSDTKRQREKH